MKPLRREVYRAANVEVQVVASHGLLRRIIEAGFGCHEAQKGELRLEAPFSPKKALALGLKLLIGFFSTKVVSPLATHLYTKFN